MAPLFSFLKNPKTSEGGNRETVTPLQSHALQDMGSIGSKRKLKKPGPNRAATNISNIKPVENLGLDTSPLAPKISAYHGDPETRSTRRMQQDLLQRSTFPPPYTPSHVQDEPSNLPQAVANSIISGHFFAEGSRYPQFTPSQARSFTVPSVRRTSFPDAQTYDEQIEDESWVNNRTQSSHNLAAQMRDPRISGAPTGATVGQDETFYNHEPSGEQPAHMWRDGTGGGTFGGAGIDENGVRRQDSQYSNHPQEINRASSRRQGSIYSNGPEEFLPDIVNRRLESQRSNRPLVSNESVASRQGSVGSNGSQTVENNVTSRHGSHRSNRPPHPERFTTSRQASLRSNHPQDAQENVTSRHGSYRSNQPQNPVRPIPSRHGSFHSNGRQENERIVTERLGSQRSNSPREVYEIIPSEDGSLRNRSQIDEPGVVLRRLDSQGNDRPQEIHETIHSRQGSLRSNRPPETKMVFTRFGSQQSLQSQETYETASRRHASLRSSRLPDSDDVASRRFESRRSRRAQSINESTGRRQGSQRSNLPPQGIQEMIASRQRSQWAQPPETIEPDVFERDYGTESEYEPEIYNYIVPVGLNVVFQDEDGNVITRVGKKGIHYQANRPVRSAPIIVHDEFGRELYRTKNLSSPPKPRPDLFNSHVKNGPAWEEYGFGSGGRIGTHDSGQDHHPPWISTPLQSTSPWRPTKTIMIDEKGNQMVLKLPNMNRERARPTEPPFHDISYHAQINYA